MATARKIAVNKKTLVIAGGSAIFLGLMAMLAPTFTGYSIIFLVGILVTIAGVARMIWAFRTSTFKKGLVLFGLGGLTFIAGIVMVTHPIFASGVLTTILVLYFLLDGVMEIFAANLLKPGTGWKWLLFGGCVSILLGVLLLLQFPVSGAWAIGILLGIKLLFIGLIMLMTRSVHVSTTI